MGIRKSLTRLTPTERNNFLRAVLTLKNTIVNPGAPAAERINIYDQFVAIHLYAININFGGSSGLNMGHQDAAFCPWHRFYLLKFEQALQAVDSSVMLPYWDWTDHTGTQNTLFQNNFIGPDGTGTGTAGRTVQSGYFAFNKPGTGGNPTPLPAWWPGTLAGWRVRPSLAQGHFGTSDPADGKSLTRALGAFSNLANLSDITTCLQKSNYEAAVVTNGFRGNLEHASKTHDFHHGWVGGNMGDPQSSPNDIMFFLHHCNIDRLWAMWQIDDHQGSAFYPSSGRPPGHNLNDPMWPWVGAAFGSYTSGNALSDIVLPNFAAQPVIHPADVLDHRALGYCYDTEAVIAIALDQTGSMDQMTPDPMVVAAPDVTKWEAAKRGVKALLHDCETAYQQRETYVIAGVKTFRTLAANTFTPVFPGTPYGIIKNGSGYSESGFDSAITGQVPGGGTPLADALLDVETNLLRLPFSNHPAHDTRFLLMLTDGNLTTGQPLSSISPGQLQDTIIFAMGFGTGAEVSYSTMNTIVSKGKAAPPTVSNQVYHGENAGEINKFFTNSIAHALNYTPTIDPTYELYPGEHVDTPFDATDADQSFMITIQGFDYNEENWTACLILPDGSSCSCDASCDSDEDDHHADTHTHSHSAGGSTHIHDQVLVTSNSKDGRITIFLNRNGADSDVWVGRWKVRVMYKMNEVNMRMFMPALNDMLFPAGARPVRGPVFAQLNYSAEQRLTMRVQAPQKDILHPFPVTGVNGDRSDPSTVAVNIYGKSSLYITMHTNAKELFAGENIAVRLEANDFIGATVSDVTAIGRLVAPNFSIGNILSSKEGREVFNPKDHILKTEGGHYFKEAKFLADFESRYPGALSMRDEWIETQYTNSNCVTAELHNNRYAGIYRMTFNVSGYVQYDGSEPQYFTRIMSFEVPVSLRFDIQEYNPGIRIEKNKLVLSYRLSDKHGNIASPNDKSNIAVFINNQEVEFKESTIAPERRIEIAFTGENVKLSENHQQIVEGRMEIKLRAEK